MFANTGLPRIPLLFDAPLTLLLFVLAAAIGNRALRKFGFLMAAPLERGLFATTLGLGLLSYVPFALFAVGLGRPSFVSAAFLLLALLLAPEEVRIVRGALRGLQRGVLNFWQREGIGSRLLLIEMALLLLYAALKALCPVTDADGLYYHLTAPSRYLMAGGFVPTPTYLHISWPLGVEMLFGIGLALDAEFPVAMIHYGFGLLLLAATYALGKRLASPNVGLMAASLLLNLSLGLIFIAYVDLALTFYTLMAITAAFTAWRASLYAEPPLLSRSSLERPANGTWDWALAGVCAGFVATTKLSGLFVIVLLSVMAFLQSWFGLYDQAIGGRLTRSLRHGLWIGGLGIGLALPWYLRSWALYGDPLFPYLWSLFHPRYWDAEAQRRLTYYQQAFTTFKSRHLPYRKVMQLRLAALGLLAGIGTILTFWRATKSVRPLLAFAFALLFMLVASSGIYSRYLFPVIPITCVLCFWALRPLLKRMHGAQAVTMLLLFFLPLGFWHVGGTVKTMISETRTSLGVALGRVSRDVYLRERIPIYPTLAWANHNLPENATVLLGSPNDAYGGLLARRALVTMVWTQNALRYDSQETLLSDMRRLGATHIVLNDEPEPTAAQIAGMDEEDRVRWQREQPLLRHVGTTFGTLLHRENGYSLYALNLPKETGTSRLFWRLFPELRTLILTAMAPARSTGTIYALELNKKEFA